MSDSLVKCPKCGHSFALSDAFLEQFEEEKRAAVAVALKEAQEKADAEVALQRKELEDAKARFDAEVALQRKELEDTKARFDDEKAHLREETKKEVEAEVALQRKELEDAKARFDDEKAHLREEIKKEVEAEVALRLREKDEELDRIGKQLKDLERRTQQGSIELQGEALESHLKQLLEQTCPFDTITEVKKGQSGADLLHEVLTPQGLRCGTITWEAKNTKVWNADWIDKIKDDAARANAHIKVIVSVALPPDIRTFDLVDGVWVCSVESAPAIARILRENMIQIANLQRAMQGKDGKMEQIYHYLISTTFRDRVQRIVETWRSLKEQVDAEERALQKQWKERRKQLDIMIDVTTEMYTDLSAIIGREMPEIEGLSLNALPSGK
ncbi:MAG: DUF2130 domain-containing protein [Chloroflexi bacterium]|nr:DUF2130 domain-containing protein [Chloroflexota bacterium]